MKFKKFGLTAFLSVLIVLPGLLAACSGAGPQTPVNLPQPTTLPPADNIHVSALAVNPPEIDAGVDVVVTARVSNTAAVEQKYIGEIKVENGSSLPDFLYSDETAIAPGDTKIVSVVVNENKAGTYRVSWSGLNGELVVRPPADITSGPTLNIAAPDFNATELISGKKISLSQYRGKVVLLNFVNYGCDPRLNAIVDKQFQAIKQLTAQRSDFVPLSVFCGCCSPDALRDFTRQNGFNWPWVLDADYSVVNKYINYVGKYSYPTMILIDADGNIRQATGFLDLPSLSTGIEQALSK